MAEPDAVEAIAGREPRAGGSGAVAGREPRAGGSGAIVGQTADATSAVGAGSGERLRVCVVGSGFRFMSGISNHTCRLANTLAERHDVSVILMRRLVPRRLYPGAARVGKPLSCLRYRPDVACFDGVDYYWLPSLAGALRFLARRRPDVIVFEWWSGSVLHSYLALALVAARLGARVVVEFHETLDTAEAALAPARLYVRALQPLFLRLARGAAVHSAVDGAIVAALPALRGKPVTVVPTGPYDHLLGLAGGGSAARAGSGTHDAAAAGDGRPRSRPGEVCELLFFGTIRPYKGLEHLIAAFDGLDAQQARGFHLTVVGETWEGWTLPAELIAASPYRERIEFVNRYVHDAEAAACFARADAVVLPYLRSSGSGPLRIAMSYGLPIGIAAVGALPQAAAGYEGARFFAPADVTALRATLLELRALKGRRYANPNSWARSIAALESLFADAVA
jgi:glycosyltransferase involved in cell wall biosynthesis